MRERERERERAINARFIKPSVCSIIKATDCGVVTRRAELSACRNNCCGLIPWNFTAGASLSPVRDREVIVLRSIREISRLVKVNYRQT